MKTILSRLQKLIHEKSWLQSQIAGIENTYRKRIIAIQEKRVSGKTNDLDVLESSINYVRQNFHKFNKNLTKLKKQEDEQRAVVNNCHRQLKFIIDFHRKIKKQLYWKQSQQEQKQMEETRAQSRFLRKR